MGNTMSHPILPPALAAPEYRALIDQCVHCGLCLPACPTYALFGTEMEAPRGRIALFRAAADGRITLDGAFRKHIESCLACRACEPACPSGVKYGALVERARAAIEQGRAPGAFERIVRRLTLRELLPHPGRLRILARILYLYQRLQLSDWVRRMTFLPAGLTALHTLLPPLSLHYPAYRQATPALSEPGGTVALFRGCVQDAFLPNVNAATIRVLQRNGYRVELPEGQTCCGAAHLHVGEEGLCQDLARRNITVFNAGNYAAVINNAGGCGATLKEYPHLLQNDPLYADSARCFAEKVKDIGEFLAAALYAPPRKPIKARVIYIDSCHLRNVQRVIRQPRELLNAIPGVELVELSHPDRCCGSAGVYNIVHPDIANALLDTKMAEIASTGASIIVVANTGCYLQMLNGARRAGFNGRVLHLVELLDESYAD